MGIPHYLAMTAAELSANPPAGPVAWMACRFSPYGGGVSNLPDCLPPDSLLILDDANPMEDHQPEWIGSSLSECMQTQGCRGLLLDFQRKDQPQAKQLAAFLAESLPCPVAVSHLYAEGLSCPVFLPPVPVHCSLESYLQPWQGREIWLEIALDGEVLTLTPEGCQICAASETAETGFSDDKLHCHYQIQLQDNAARFTLWRTKSDLDNLLEEAAQLGVAAAVGLWQELGW